MYDKIEEADYKFESPYWDMISDEAKDFISQCFILDKTERLTIEKAFAHPWIKVCVPRILYNVILVLTLELGS